MRDAKKIPCPVCGATGYEWEEVQGENLRFLPDEAGFLKRTFSLAYKMQARRCLDCGNVQLFQTE